MNVNLNVSHIYETPWENKMKLYPETKLDQSIEQFIAPYNTNDELKKLDANYTIDELNDEFKSLTDIESSIKYDISIILKIVCRAYSFKGYKVNGKQISKNFDWQDVYYTTEKKELNNKLKAYCPIILKIIQIKINDFLENIDLDVESSNDVFKIGGGGIFSKLHPLYQPTFTELVFDKKVTITGGKVTKNIKSDVRPIPKSDRYHTTFSFFLGGGIDQQERINTYQERFDNEEPWNNRRWNAGSYTLYFGGVDKGIHLTFILDTSFITTNENDKFFVGGDIFGHCNQKRNRLWPVADDKYMATIKIPYGGKYKTIYYNYYKNPSTQNSYLTSEKINTENGLRKLEITSANGYKAGKNYRINDYFGSTKHIQNISEGESIKDNLPKIYKKLKFSLDVNSVTDRKDSDTYHIGGGYFGNANAFKLTKKNDNIYESGEIKVPYEFNFNFNNYKLEYAYYRNLSSDKDLAPLEFIKKEKFATGTLGLGEWGDRILKISPTEKDTDGEGFKVIKKNEVFGKITSVLFELKYNLILSDNQYYHELKKIETMDINGYTAFTILEKNNINENNSFLSRLNEMQLILEIQDTFLNSEDIKFINDNTEIKVNEAFTNSQFFNSINTNVRKVFYSNLTKNTDNNTYFFKLLEPKDLNNFMPRDNLKFTFQIKSKKEEIFKFKKAGMNIPDNKFLIYFPHIKIPLKLISNKKEVTINDEGTLTREVIAGDDNNYKFTIRIDNNKHNTNIEFDFPDNDYFEIKSKKIHNKVITGDDDKKKLIIEPQLKNQDITFGLKDLTDKKIKELLDNGTVIKFPKYKQDDHQKSLKLVTLKKDRSNENLRRSTLGYAIDKSYVMYPTDSTGNTFYKKGLPGIKDNQLFRLEGKISTTDIKDINNYKIEILPVKLNFLQKEEWMIDLDLNFYKESNWEDNEKLRVYFLEKPSPIEYKLKLKKPGTSIEKVITANNKNIGLESITQNNINGKSLTIYYFEINITEFNLLKFDARTKTIKLKNNETSFPLNLEIPKDYKLLIEKTKVFTNKGNIINNGTIDNSGTFNNNGTIDNINIGKITNKGTIDNIKGYTITNKGTIDNNGDKSKINNNSTITNYGAITNTRSIINNDTITNNGSIDNYNTITNNQNGTITNDGKIINATNGTIENKGAITNNVTITNNNIITINNSCVLSNNGTINNNNSLVVYGTLNNNNGSTINNNRNGDVIGEVSYSGTINNKGTINNQGIFYKSVFRGSFTGKPDSITLTDGLFGILSSTANNAAEIIVPKNTELKISKNVKLNNNNIINNNGTITNHGIIEIKKNYKITNNGIINNSFTITNNGIIDNNHRITNNATINNNKNGIITNPDFRGIIENNDSITNNGKINNRFKITNEGTIDNNKDGTITNSYSITNNSTITNNGTIENYDTITNGHIIANYNIINNNGEICNKTNGKFNPRGKININQPVICK